MRHFHKIVALILTACMLLPCATALAAEETGERPIRPRQYQALLGRGMDVDWCKTSAGMEAYNSRAVHDFKEAGVSHVRIRIKDEADEALLDLLEQQVEDCLDAGLIPVIAYQADELKNDPSNRNLRKVEKWWRTVAERFRDAPYLLAFDLIIEVTDALKDQPQRLNEIYEQLVSAVRKTNPERIVMIAPRLRSDAAYLRDLAIPTAANGYLMAEWHFYAAGPSKTNERKLWTTGTETEKQLIQDKINLALAWQEETGVPTWVGAWMAGNYNDGNDYTVPEQAAFAAYMTEALTKAGIPFAVNADTHFYNRESNVWIEEMQPIFDAIYAAENVPVFSDVPADAWYGDAVKTICGKEIMSGTSATTFSPDGRTTRGMIAAVLYRLAGSPGIKEENWGYPFADVDANAYYGTAVYWVRLTGIAGGYSAEYFGPNDPITREQLAAMLYRYAAYQGFDTAACADLSDYTDHASIHGYAIQPMAWANAGGLISGSGGALMPQAYATRAQTAVILARFLEEAAI